MKKLVMDLDNTITIESDLPYNDKKPNLEVIEKMKEYYSNGFSIAIYTARNMNSLKNNVGAITAITLPIIIDWLNKHDVPYDEIFVGKPWCGHGGFYVDDKAIRPNEFINLTHESIQSLVR